ncbi:actin regulatory protein [Laccaria bicolor S238N-H82]|uniref:Actin regulatory protein n=1 Tax=Laccaria bicolor (strain S238N-H82 / ATCC MYA-4686) TaxID=486041 RepID=B0D6F6_LACBS|nr:actin regulatory protein [Laccaria bicolor S238N-H82]EDR10182.1 actin regulatory protein [Laccaria bicolor S238N-H82]|eukprot:XP_001879567.1 actin regulatory protein [Laccaria bicolor S238N-H82]
MPATSTLDADDKSKVKAAVPISSNKIIFAALSRIYYAYPQPDKWSYAGLQGGLVFARDTHKNILYFRLVDLDGTRGVIWEHELYEGLEYSQDRGFFHSFAGDKCMIGFVFAEEHEAKIFYKKVMMKKDAKAKKNTSKPKKLSISKGGRVDKSMISGPQAGSFKHIAHMGYDAEAGFTSKGVDPSWTTFLGNLENSGVDKAIIEENMEFIKNFTARNHHPPENHHLPESLLPENHQLPESLLQLQPRYSHHHHHAAQRPHKHKPTTRHHLPLPGLQADSPTGPLRPLHVPPYHPLQNQQYLPQHVQPYRPPHAQPSLHVVLPRLRVRPPIFHLAVRLLPLSHLLLQMVHHHRRRLLLRRLRWEVPGRGDLLASIKGAGIHQLKKADPNANANAGPPSAGGGGRAVPSRIAPLEPQDTGTTTATGTTGSGSGGGDLTSALAAALLERNKRLGDSDDDEDDDDEDWD